MTYRFSDARPDVVINAFAPAKGFILELVLRMAAYFFTSPVDVDIMLEGEDVRKQIESKAEKDRPVSCPVYYDGESVSGQVRLIVLLLWSFLLLHFGCAETLGQVTVRVRDGKRTTHDGIKVEFVGNIGTFLFLCASWDLFCSRVTDLGHT